MIKKSSLVTTPIIILILTITTTFADSIFPDIDNNHPYKTAIEYLKTNEVIIGYPDGTFKPDNTVNRAELLKILIESGGYEISEPTNNCFPDVTTEKWFSKYVCFAKEKGWISGYQDGYFRPEQTVNKVEALKIMGNVEGWTFENATESNFEDADYNQWYGPYLQYAETKKLLPESEQGNLLSPAAGMSRAAIAENIFRSIALRQLKEDSFSADIISNIITESIIPLTKLTGPKVVINEVRYDENTLGWIELFNKDSETVNLENWSLTNSEAQKFLTFPEILLPSKSYLVVYLEQGENDLDFSDKFGNYYLNRTEGLLRTDEDAIALFNSENVSADSLVDFVSYCNTGECSQGIAYNMATSRHKWLKDDYVSYIYTPKSSELIIGRSKQSIDTNSSSDWSFDGGINAGISTPGEKNYVPDVAEEDFDEILTIPFDPNNDTFFDDSDVVASINTNYLLAEKHCDPVEVLKQAIEMLKRSCLEEGDPLGAIDESKLTGKQDPKNTKATEVQLTDKIKIRLGKSSSHIKGRTHPPDEIDGEMVIEINLKQIDCNPENMKAVLFHELTHEKQVREKGTGIWDKDGKRVKPAGTNPAHGTNNIDPLTMIADCMEVETHLLTAQCLQKEQRMSEFNEYGEAIEKLLDKSKKLAQRYWKHGPKRDDPETDDSEADPQRKGCWNYINQIKNNISPDNKKIRNPQWLEENKKIKEYVDKWLEKIQKLILIFYEKYYDHDKIIKEGRDGRREKARWERFVTGDLFLPKEEADETIGDWEEELERRINEMEASILEDDNQSSIDNQPSTEEETPAPNEPPKIILNPSSPNCITGNIIYIYADQSYDLDGYIEEYQWYLSGSLYGSNEFIGYNCATPGAVTMTLRVTDDLGTTASKNFTITATDPVTEEEPEETLADTPQTNQAPIASIYPAQPSCSTGNSVSIYASESYDPDGTISEYGWYSNTGILYSSTNSMTYDCMSPGTKALQLRLTDNEGLTTNHNFNVIVN